MHPHHSSREARACHSPQQTALSVHTTAPSLCSQRSPSLTRPCLSVHSPSWKHEKIAFYVGNGKHLRRPLAVQIELHATDSPAAVGALLASGVVHLSECCSEATAALTPTDLLQAAPTVVFCAQVGPWLDE